MDADSDTLVTALYVKIDDALKADPGLVRWRPEVGIAPKLSDAELICLAVLQALLGFTSETRWLRYTRTHLVGLFPYVPGQSGYNKRLRKAAGQLVAINRILAMDTDLWADDTWVIDSTPIECGRSRQTAKRSDLLGFAGYGYCASPRILPGEAGHTLILQFYDTGDASQPGDISVLPPPDSNVTAGCSRGVSTRNLQGTRPARRGER